MWISSWQLHAEVHSSSHVHASGKVRTLDLAQTRVQETLGNIKAVIDRTNCINGVQAAMEAEVHDVESLVQINHSQILNKIYFTSEMCPFLFSFIAFS